MRVTHRTSRLPRLPRIFPVIALAAMSIVLGSCTNSMDETTEQISIGVNIELTGASAVQGAAFRNALELVADDLKDKLVLDKRINLIVKDNKSNAAEATKIARELIDNDNVVAMISGSSDTTLAIVDTVQNRKIPTVSMGSAKTIVSPLDKHPFIFKTTANNDTVAQVMADEFVTKKIDSVAVLWADNSFGQDGLTEFNSAARKSGIQVVADAKFAETAQNFTPQITSLVSAQPDAIVVWAAPPNSARIAQEIREAKYRGKVYFDAAAGAELFVKGAGVAAENMFMVHPTILAAQEAPTTTPSVLAQKEFFTEYSQRFGEYSGFASYAADALKLIVAAIEKADSEDPQKIRDALETLTFDGLTGSYAFSPTDHGGVSADALSVLTVRNSAWILAE